MKIPPTFHLFVLLSHVGPNSQISISAMIMVALQNNDTDKNICNDNQNNLFFYLGHFPYVGHPFDAVADDKHWKKWCNVTNDSLTNRSSCLLWQNGRLNSIGETKWNRGGVEVDLEQWRGWLRQVPLRVVASWLATLPGLVPAHQHDDDGDDGDTDDGVHLPHCTMCCLYSIFSLQPNEVGHDLTPHNHSTYFFHNSFDCEENYFMNVFVSFKLEICDFPWIIPLQQLLDFGVLCPNLCLNTWEFYYPPLYHTQGNIGQDPTATVQTAHCALASLSW